MRWILSKTGSSTGKGIARLRLVERCDDKNSINDSQLNRPDTKVVTFNDDDGGNDHVFRLQWHNVDGNDEKAHCLAVCGYDVRGKL